jgi:outer membrane lipoprotein-sorting protein
LLRTARTAVFLSILTLPLTGCLFRTHKVEKVTAAGPVQTASIEELVSKINSEAVKIKTLNATVDIATTAGGQKKGKVTEFTEIRGYILMRKPTMLRMIGLFPVVRNRAFDMVSDGQSFKLSVPPRNKFIVGKNELEKPSPNALENLRPQHIMDALLLREIDPKNEIAFLEATTEVLRDAKSKKNLEYASYVVNVIRRDAENNWALSRKIIFSRADLEPRQQIVFDKLGNIATIATYNNFSDFQGVRFPAIIQIERPQEEYSIQLAMVKLRLNEAMKDEQFDLQQPAGSQLMRVGENATATETKQNPHNNAFSQ